MWKDRDKLSIAKEETRDLQRLLNESYVRLEAEYEKKGGKTWWELFWYMFGYIV